MKPALDRIADALEAVADVLRQSLLSKPEASALSRLNFGIVCIADFSEPPPKQGGSHEEEVYCATHG